MTDTYFEEEEFATQFNGQTILRILAQAKPHWPMMLGFLLCISLVALMDSYFTFLSKQIIDEAIANQDNARLLDIIKLYGGMIVFQAAGVLGFIYFAGLLGERIRYDLRRKMVNHLQTLSFSYFDKTPIGWIISRVTSDTERIAELVTWGLLDITWGIMSISGSLVFMFMINWRMALIVSLIVPILIIVAAEFKKHIFIDSYNIKSL